MLRGGLAFVVVQVVQVLQLWLVLQLPAWESR